jgi:glucuronoarabinoxylan endo-1,4-beta-xylanase
MKTMLYFLLIGLLFTSSCKKEVTKPNSPPTINAFTYKVLSTSPYEVEFQVAAIDQDLESIRYFWNFGDGKWVEGKSTEKRTFEPEKDYTVEVGVRDAKNETKGKVSFSTKFKPVSITLDAATRFQTMQGFGGFGAEKVWWDNAPFYSADFVKTLIEDLGVTILRDEIPHSFEPGNDNADSKVINWAGYNTTRDADGSDSNLGQQFPYLKAMKDAGLQKLIATVWTPPLFMKHIQHRGNGVNNASDAGAYSAPAYTNSPTDKTNQLRTDMYEEFAEYCVAYVRLLKERTGIDLYALSIQNEPRFSQFYGSCVHSPESLRDLVKVVGRRFKAEGISTKLFVPEDVQSIFHIRQYLNTILNDSEASSYVDIFAIHNYQNDGINPSNEGPSNWRETYDLANKGKKEVWMTETSGFKPGFEEGGLLLARSIYNALYYGNASAWVYWQMSDGSDGALIRNGQKTNLYHVSKHFYKYIRPGAVRIKAESGDNNLPVLAFEHPDKTNTIVAFNLGAEHMRVSLKGLSSGAYDFYLSDATNSFSKAAAKVNAEGTVVVPGKSIFTLTNRN